MVNLSQNYQNNVNLVRGERIGSLQNVQADILVAFLARIVQYLIKTFVFMKHKAGTLNNNCLLTNYVIPCYICFVVAINRLKVL